MVFVHRETNLDHKLSDMLQSVYFVLLLVLVFVPSKNGPSPTAYDKLCNVNNTDRLAHWIGDLGSWIFEQ